MPARLTVFLVVAALVCPAASVARSDRTPLGTVYAGETARQSGNVVLRLTRGGKLDHVDLTIGVPCNDGSGFLYGDHFGFADRPPTSSHLKSRGLSRTGTFRATGGWTGKASDGSDVRYVDVLSGKVTARAASGTLRVRIFDTNATTHAPRYQCDTGSLRWKLRSSPGHVYGGLTSQGYAVVLEVNARRTRVTRFWTSVRRECTPAATEFDGPFFDSSFALRQHGFQGIVTDQFDAGGGLTGHDSDTLVGRVGAYTASGSFRETGQYVDATGAVQRTCDTGTLTWHARSS
jgi:hypothetical protein